MKYGRAAKVATMAIIFIAIVTAMTAIAKTDGDQADARQKTALIDTMGTASSASRTTNTTATAPEVHGADNWNDVGFTGDGIRVGVIDTDYDGLGQVLTDHHGGDLTVHCYRGRLVPSDRLQDCHTGNDHGTAVVRNLLEITPDVDLYISDAYSPEDVAKAAQWMADQDVRIITASITSHWDGPGDGTGTQGWPDENSLIATAHDAVGEGILWIAPAGNQRTNGLFYRSPTFTDNFLDVQSDGTITGTCHEMSAANNTERLRLRWEDNWPTSESDAGPTTDLAIRLYTKATSDAEATQVLPEEGYADAAQAGLSTQHPREELNFSVTAGAHYCIYVEKKTGPTPDWVQLQSEHSGIYRAEQEDIGTIVTPAESNNAGVLAVGATLAGGTILNTDSSRGPAPEPGPPNERVKPDLVAIGNYGHAVATSFAAPRVAGLAALVMDADASVGQRTAPALIARYLKDRAVLPAQPTTRDEVNPLPPTIRPNNHWGHGLAFLPFPLRPANVRIITDGSPTLSISFGKGAWETPAFGGRAAIYKVAVWRKGQGTTEDRILFNLQIGGTATRIGVPSGHTYYVTVQRCVETDVTGYEDYCGAAVQSNEVFVELPKPDRPDPTAESGSSDEITISWATVRHASSYQVQQWDGNKEEWRILTFTEQGQTSPYTLTVHELDDATGKLSATIGNLTEGVTYSQRIVAVNTTGKTRSPEVDTMAGTAQTPEPDPTPTPPGQKMPAANLAFTTTGTTVSLTWTAHVNPHIERQIVKRRVAGTNPIVWTEFSVALSDTSYTDDATTAGTEYVYRVQGFTATSGPNGWLSNPVTVGVPTE